jgi:hypothetical protein
MLSNGVRLAPVSQFCAVSNADAAAVRFFGNAVYKQSK